MAPRILLVGYEDQDNLGLRYLASRRTQASFGTSFLEVPPNTFTS